MIDYSKMNEDLNEMPLLDKIKTVRSLVAKAQASDDYSTQINLPVEYSADDFFTQALVVADMAEKLSTTNELDKLYSRERQEAYAHVNSSLDFILSCFPEYSLKSGQRSR